MKAWLSLSTSRGPVYVSFSCPFCGVGLTRQGWLLIHGDTKTGFFKDKKVECDDIGKKFYNPFCVKLEEAK